MGNVLTKLLKSFAAARVEAVGAAARRRRARGGGGGRLEVAGRRRRVDARHRASRRGARARHPVRRRRAAAAEPHKLRAAQREHPEPERAGERHAQQHVREQRGEDADTGFRRLLVRYGVALRPPLNEAARGAAGFSAEELRS